MKQLAIIGTTASGKTALALKLASEFNGAILSLDSLCIYKEIDIASAKPTPTEIASVPHFGVNLLAANEHFDVGMFFDIYKSARKFAQENGKNLFIVGGSGFYLKALLSGLSPKFERVQNPPTNAQIYELILRHDSEFAAKFSQNDTYRLQKWFDIYSFLQSAGILQAPSEHLRENTRAPIVSNLAIFEIDWDKDELRERIKERTKNMLANGLLDEARRLFAHYPQQPKPLKSIGLKECGEYLWGENSSQEADDLNFAKISQNNGENLYSKSMSQGEFGSLNFLQSGDHFLRNEAVQNETIVQNGSKFSSDVTPQNKVAGSNLKSTPKISSIEELAQLISTHTAQLAKRQRTFNRSQFEAKFIGSLAECEAKIREFLKG